MIKRYLIHVLIFVCITLSVAVVAIVDNIKDNRSTPTVINGVIDLTHWSFEQDGIIRLDGDWHFDSNITDSPSYERVPSYWREGTTEATYNLEIKTPKGYKDELDLYVPYPFSSYQINIDDKVVVRNGVYSSDKQLDWTKEIVSFQPSSEVTKLTITVQNTEYFAGGLAHSISIGSREVISRFDNIKLGKELTYVIIFLMIGVFHFTFIRSADRAPLWMGIYCAQIAIYELTFHDRYFLSLFDISWDIILKIQFINLYTCLLSFHFFLKESFYNKLAPAVSISLVVITIFQVGAILLTPSSFYTDLFLYVFGPTMMIVCGNAIITFYIEAKRGTKYAAQNLAGFIVLTIASFTDFFNHNGIIQTDSWVAEGLMFYLFIQAIIVKNRYRDAFTKSEHLNTELKENNTKLIKANELIEEKMTETSHAREEADRALVSKTQFLALISHELRTPITSSYQLIESLEDMTLNNKRASSFVRLSLATMEPVFNLLNDIIDFSTIEYNKTLKINPKPFDLIPMIKNVYLSHQKMANDKNISMELDHSGVSVVRDMSIVTDQTRIRQVLSNFIINAIKYTKNNGHVNICYRVQKAFQAEGTNTHTIILEVKDDGIGIEDSEQENIFEMFRQINSDNIESSSHGGYGLGLALCKVIIEEMKGRISVRSKVNIGSIFTAEIPVSFCDKRNTFSTIDSMEISDVRILLVEDDPSIQLATSTLLRNVGISVDVAGNAIDGMRLCQLHSYDMVFIDCYLPGTNGFELTRQIREWESVKRIPNIPIIGQSASPQQDVIEAAMDAGMNDFMGKPYKKIDLYRMIHLHKDWNKEIERVLNSSSASS